ncbi:hypothetical protein JZ751_016122, partial [Albula glossodonta]
AFGQAYSTQRKVAADGESNEETLLQESASKEAYYMGRLLELQAELKQSRSHMSNTQAENERLSGALQELRESKEVLELQRNRLKEEVEYEGLKHEIKVLEEETVLLNSQLEEALRLRQISQTQLEEALDSLRSEREVRNSLRKELAHYLSLGECVYGPSNHMALAEALALADALAGSTPSTDDRDKCNGHTPGSDHAEGTATATKGDISPASRKGEGLHPVSDLFSELNLSEIQKLKQQLLQVEREKTALLATLQESQTQLQHMQGVLTEQHRRVHHLSESLNAMRRLQGQMELGAESEKEGSSSSSSPPPGCQELDLEVQSMEVLKCKYRVAVTEVVGLQGELKALQETYRRSMDCLEGERSRGEERLRVLRDHVTRLEQSRQEGQERIGGLEAELRAATGVASESHSMLTAAQEELVTFSEELAQLYHHVCLCNNETPNRVMLDYYRQGRMARCGGSLRGSDDVRALLSPRLSRRITVAPLELRPADPSTKDPTRLSTPPSPSTSPIPEPAVDLRREPMNLYNLNAIIRDQIKHLQRAVHRAMQLSRQRAVARELAPILDKDKEACMEEILKLKRPRWRWLT